MITKELETILKSMITRIDTINERTKIHTLDIRELKKHVACIPEGSEPSTTDNQESK